MGPNDNDDNFDDELPDESGPLPADEEDEDDGESEGAERSETMPAPPPSPVAGQKLVKKGPGRPKKAPGHGEGKRGPPPKAPKVGRAGLQEVARTAGRPPKGVTSRQADEAAAELRGEPEGPIDPQQEPTKELVARWPLVLEMLQSIGLGPEAVAMRVWCVADGPYASQPTLCGPIDGRMVAGGGDRDPADMLADYIISVFHSRTRVPATYRVEIFFKVPPRGRPRGGTMICSGNLALASYETIMQQRQAALDFTRQNPPSVPNLPALPGMPQFIPSQVPGGQPTIIMPPAPAPAPGQPAMPEFMQQMMATMQGMMTEMFTRMMRGEPIGPQAPAPVVMQAPAPMAMAAPPPPPAAPTIEDQLETVAKLITLVDKIRPPAPPVVAAAPATGLARAPRQHQEEPATPFSGVKDALKMIRELGSLQEEIATLTGQSGPAEEEEPRPAPQEEAPITIRDIGGVKWPSAAAGKEKLSMLEQAQHFMMLNPDVSLKFMSGLSNILDRSAVAQFLQYLIARGNPQQQAVAQQALQGVGARPPSVPPPAPLPVMPPVVRPPMANGASPAAEPSPFVSPATDWKPAI